MYNDNASEVPLYLVPNSEGTGKRLVRRPHPPPTSAPLPDDFDAITDTRDGTTVYSDAQNSALAIDYDALTIAAPVYEHPAPPLTPTPTGIHAPVPIPFSRTPLATPTKQRRAVSPSHTLAGPDARSPPRGGDGPTYDKGLGLGLSVGKARSVAGDRTPRRSLGPSGNLPPLAPPFSPGRGSGPSVGRSELVEKKVFEDGPERTISVWREHVAKTGGERDRGREGEGDGRSEVDSHVGRRRVSTESRRRVESFAQVPGGSVKGKGHRSKESAEFTELSHSSLQPSLSSPGSSTPHANALPTSSSQPTTPQQPQRRQPPTSPTVGPKGSEYSASVSDTTCQTKVPSAIESILSSCQPSLLHLLPILEELGVRHSEHMTALARMREETRDREVKEEALKKGITVVEWAIFIDKLQSL